MPPFGLHVTLFVETFEAIVVGEASAQGHVRCAVLFEKPRSLVKCEYVFKRTDRWVNFPWSTQPPVAIGS